MGDFEDFLFNSRLHVLMIVGLGATFTVLGGIMGLVSVRKKDGQAEAEQAEVVDEMPCEESVVVQSVSGHQIPLPSSKGPTDDLAPLRRPTGGRPTVVTTSVDPTQLATSSAPPRGRPKITGSSSTAPPPSFNRLALKAFVGGTAIAVGSTAVLVGGVAYAMGIRSFRDVGDRARATVPRWTDRARSAAAAAGVRSTSADLDNVETDSATAADQWPANWVKSLGFVSDPTAPDPVANETADAPRSDSGNAP